MKKKLARNHKRKKKRRREKITESDVEDEKRVSIGDVRRSSSSEVRHFSPAFSASLARIGFRKPDDF